MVQLQIELISRQIRAWPPLRKAQRIEEVTYESPALPLSYSAAARDSSASMATDRHATVVARVDSLAERDVLARLASLIRHLRAASKAPHLRPPVARSRRHRGRPHAPRRLEEPSDARPVRCVSGRRACPRGVQAPQPRRSTVTLSDDHRPATWSVGLVGGDCALSEIAEHLTESIRVSRADDGWELSSEAFAEESDVRGRSRASPGDGCARERFDGPMARRPRADSRRQCPPVPTRRREECLCTRNQSSFELASSPQPSS